MDTRYHLVCHPDIYVITMTVGIGDSEDRHSDQKCVSSVIVARFAKEQWERAKTVCAYLNEHAITHHRCPNCV